VTRGQGVTIYQAARDLLLRRAPRLDGAAIRYSGEVALDAALRIAPALDGGIFPIQGPPGAGKTHTGARMICALAQAGKTVGITAFGAADACQLPCGPSRVCIGKGWHSIQSP
jgi:hypothetical protein